MEQVIKLSFDAICELNALARNVPPDLKKIAIRILGQLIS